MCACVCPVLNERFLCLLLRACLLSFRVCFQHYEDHLLLILLLFPQASMDPMNLNLAAPYPQQSEQVRELGSIGGSLNYGCNLEGHQQERQV